MSRLARRPLPTLTTATWATAAALRLVVSFLTTVTASVAGATGRSAIGTDQARLRTPGDDRDRARALEDGVAVHDRRIQDVRALEVDPGRVVAHGEGDRSRSGDGSSLLPDDQGLRRRRPLVHERDDGDGIRRQHPLDLQDTADGTRRRRETDRHQLEEQGGGGGEADEEARGRRRAAAIAHGPDLLDVAAPAVRPPSNSLPCRILARGRDRGNERGNAHAAGAKLRPARRRSLTACGGSPGPPSRCRGRASAR